MSSAFYIMRLEDYRPFIDEYMRTDEASSINEYNTDDILSKLAPILSSYKYVNDRLSVALDGINIVNFTETLTYVFQLLKGIDIRMLSVVNLLRLRCHPMSDGGYYVPLVLSVSGMTGVTDGSEKGEFYCYPDPFTGIPIGELINLCIKKK